MWRNVIWSDESPFVLRFNRKVRCYKHHGEVGNPQLLTGTVKHDTKINVWGCFSAKGLGNFYRIHGIMFKEDYNMILETQAFFFRAHRLGVIQALPSIEHLAPNEY
jgi:hypothetical protein